MVFNRRHWCLSSSSSSSSSPPQSSSSPSSSLQSSSPLLPSVISCCAFGPPCRLAVKSPSSMSLVAAGSGRRLSQAPTDPLRVSASGLRPCSKRMLWFLVASSLFVWLAGSLSLSFALCPPVQIGAVNDVTIFLRACCTKFLFWAPISTEGPCKFQSTFRRKFRSLFTSLIPFHMANEVSRVAQRKTKTRRGPFPCLTW